MPLFHTADLSKHYSLSDGDAASRPDVAGVARILEYALHPGQQLTKECRELFPVIGIQGGKEGNLAVQHGIDEVFN